MSRVYSCIEACIWQELSDNSLLELQPVLDWLEDKYIGRPNRRRRHPPVFPQQMWNVHDRVVQQLHGSHQQPRRSRPPANPSLTPDEPFNALEVYRWTEKVQKGRDLFHEQLVAGHAHTRKLRRYRLCDERIQRIVQNYANYGIVDYLRGLAHNFEMN